MLRFFDKDGGDGAGSGGGQSLERLKVGEKEYTADDVNGLVTQLNQLKGGEKVLARLNSMAEGVGIEPDVLAEQGFAALQVVNDLITTGIIDETGKVISRGSGDGAGKGKPTGDDGLDDLFKLEGGDGSGGKGGDKGDKGMGKDVSEQLKGLLAQVLTPIQQAITDIDARIGKTESVTTGMLEESFTGKILGKHPELTPADVKQVFAAARGDKSKTIWDHAAAFANAKVADRVGIEKAFAEKHGLNFEQLNENLLKEQGADGAPPVPEGKKISFRKGVEGAVSPSDLAGEFLLKSNRR